MKIIYVYFNLFDCFFYRETRSWEIAFGTMSINQNNPDRSLFAVSYMAGRWKLDLFWMKLLA